MNAWRIFLMSFLIGFPISTHSEDEIVQIRLTELEGWEAGAATHALSTCLMDLFRPEILEQNRCSLVKLERMAQRIDETDPTSFIADWEICPDRQRRGLLTVTKSLSGIEVEWRQPRDSQVIFSLKSDNAEKFLRFDGVVDHPKDLLKGAHIVYLKQAGQVVHLFDQNGDLSSFQFSYTQLASCLRRKAGS